jgi:hypothetical protein
VLELLKAGDVDIDILPRPALDQGKLGGHAGLAQQRDQRGRQIDAVGDAAGQRARRRRRDEDRRGLIDDRACPGRPRRRRAARFDRYRAGCSERGDAATR